MGWLALAAPGSYVRADGAGVALAVVEGPNDCADGAAFDQLLRAKLSPRAVARAAQRRLALRLVREGARLRGSLSVEGEGGTIRRELSAESCDEVLGAMALVAALLLEPPPASSPRPRASSPRRAPPPPAPAEASEERAGEAAASAEATSAPEGAAPKAPSDPVDSADSAAALAAPAAVDGAASAELAGSAARAAWGPTFSLFAGGALATGVAPAPRPAALLGAQFGMRRGAWELALDAGARAALPHRERSGMGTARFFLWAAALRACTQHWLQPSLGLAACAVAELGQLAARGSQTDNPRSARSLWAALGPALAITVQTPRRLWLQLAAGPLFPLPRQRYRLGEDDVFSVPRVTFRAELALGVRFL